MNAVEIEEAVSALAAEPFDAEAFPWAFLQAFGNKETTIKRLRSGQSNASDVPGGVLQRNNIHLAVAPAGEVAATLKALRDSPKAGSAHAKFILATDGEMLEAEDLLSGDPLACAYPDLAQAFAFFLPLAVFFVGQGDQEQPGRREGDRAAQQALRRAARGQSRLGDRRAPPRAQPVHGAADLLLLRGGHRHLPRGAVHRHDRAVH